MMRYFDSKGVWTAIFCGLAMAYLILLPVLQFPLTSLLKPLPILCLLLLCLNSSLTRQPRRYLMVALVFSIAGDIVLTLPLQRQLEVGLSFFLVAHCAYIRLFTDTMQVTRYAVALSLALISASVSFFCWIHPYLAALRLPVALYVTVLTAMAVASLLGEGHSRRTVFGALCFMGSDALIALNHFVYPSSNFTLAVMLGYYTAQYCIITGVLWCEQKVQPNVDLSPLRVRHCGG